MARGTLAGLIDQTPDWRAELDWVRAAGPDGVILFESVSEGLGRLQDALRGQGFNVIGGSAYGDRLENDRAFAQGVLAELGLRAAPAFGFQSPAQALDFIAQRPARYVLKASGSDHEASDTFVGALSDGRDVAALLRAWPPAPRDFILMDFIEGVEMGVGAYFNGERFITPACLDWEHKRFFAGDMGEMTGEMGTVVTFERTGLFFELTLARMAGRLREHGYVGYINLNTIVNDAGIWPLEFTCRFGYPGFAILSPLQATPWGELLGALTTRSSLSMRTRPGFCLGVVVTTPPFPYSRKQVSAPVGLPVTVLGEIDPRHIHYGEVGLDAQGQLVTSGLYGWTLVVTGAGATVEQAKAQAYARAAQVVAPNGRYRLDIGDRLIAGQLTQVEALGLLTTAENPPGQMPTKRGHAR
jgi:phosphoribosylamine--glycine ligase